MPQLMTHHQRAQRANRIAEKRMRSVERIDVTQLRRELCPPRRLHRARKFQRQLIKAALPGARRSPPLMPKSQQVSIRADIVESMIVHPDMAYMRRHPLDRRRTTQFQKSAVTRGIKLQNR